MLQCSKRSMTLQTTTRSASSCLSTLSAQLTMLHHVKTLQSSTLMMLSTTTLSSYGCSATSAKQMLTAHRECMCQHNELHHLAFTMSSVRRTLLLQLEKKITKHMTKMHHLLQYEMTYLKHSASLTTLQHSRLT